MKCILTTTVWTMSCLPAYSRASAQATVQANLPFEFTIGQRVLPPDDYSIPRVASSVIEIESRRNAPVSMFPLSPVSMSAGSPTRLYLASMVTSAFYENWEAVLVNTI